MLESGKRERIRLLAYSLLSPNAWASTTASEAKTTTTAQTHSIHAFILRVWYVPQQSSTHVQPQKRNPAAARKSPIAQAQFQ
jgi:hypothetical protein